MASPLPGPAATCLIQAVSKASKTRSWPTAIKIQAAVFSTNWLRLNSRPLKIRYAAHELVRKTHMRRKVRRRRRILQPLQDPSNSFRRAQVGPAAMRHGKHLEHGLAALQHILGKIHGAQILVDGIETAALEAAHRGNDVCESAVKQAEQGANRSGHDEDIPQRALLKQYSGARRVRLLHKAQ